MMSALGRANSSSILISLIIPILFSIFMTSSLDRVWGFYNMIQIQGSLLWILPMVFPAMGEFTIQIGKSISFFNIFKNPQI
jgi:hypothetical protein